VILLLAAESGEWEPQLASGAAVRAGQRIGTLHTA